MNDISEIYSDDYLKDLLLIDLWKIISDYMRDIIIDTNDKYKITIDNVEYQGIRIIFNHDRYIEFIQHRDDSCPGL